MTFDFACRVAVRAERIPDRELFLEQITMRYTMKVKESDVLGSEKYVNQHGYTESVEFVRQVTNAPRSTVWKRGMSVREAKFGDIPRGTAIATFDSEGKFPVDLKGRHAAIFLGVGPAGIQVLDQRDGQGKVLPRTIRFNRPGCRSNNGDEFYVIE